MTFPELVKAALELGIIPALALFLVVAMHLQNRQLMKDRRDMEISLLRTLREVIATNQDTIDRLYDKLQSTEKSDETVKREQRRRPGNKDQG